MSDRNKYVGQSSVDKSVTEKWHTTKTYVQPQERALIYLRVGLCDKSTQPSWRSSHWCQKRRTHTSSRATRSTSFVSEFLWHWQKIPPPTLIKVMQHMHQLFKDVCGGFLEVMFRFDDRWSFLERKHWLTVMLRHTLIFNSNWIIIKGLYISRFKSFFQKSSDTYFILLSSLTFKRSINA